MAVSYTHLAKDKAAKPEPAPEPEAVSAPAEGTKAGKKGKKKAASEPPAAPEPEPAPEEPQRKVPPEIEELIAGALDMIADEDGYAFMGELGNLLILSLIHILYQGYYIPGREDTSTK